MMKNEDCKGPQKQDSFFMPGVPDLYFAPLPENILTKQPLLTGGAEEDEELERPHPHPE